MPQLGWFVNLMQLAPRLEPVSLSMVLIAILGLASLAWRASAMSKTKSAPATNEIRLELSPTGKVTLLTKVEVAAQLKITDRTLDGMVKRGEFPAPMRISKFCLRWQQATVDAWIAEREAAAKA